LKPIRINKALIQPRGKGWKKEKVSQLN